MKVVQAMLRHSSIAVTADTYTSVLPDLARNAAEQAAAIVPRRATVTPIDRRAAG
jgi:integrase